MPIFEDPDPIGSSGGTSDWEDYLEAISGGLLNTGTNDVLPGDQEDIGVFDGDWTKKVSGAGIEVSDTETGLDPAAIKPDLKPAPIKKQKKAKLKDTMNPYMDPAGLLAEIMSMSGKPLESTNRSRYSPVEEGVPELETPRDDWSGLLQTMLEDKKRKEAMALASSRRLG